MSFFLKVAPALISWGIFLYVIFQVPYPKSLTQASPYQLFSFFASLFLATIFSINIFLKNFFSSASISLGIIFLLLLKALDALNFVSIGLIILAVILFLNYFKKHPSTSSGLKNLTYTQKVPKLHAMRHPERSRRI